MSRSHKGESSRSSKSTRSPGKNLSWAKKLVAPPRKTYRQNEAYVIRAAYVRYRFGARMLETMIRKQFKICISHNRIHFNTYHQQYITLKLYVGKIEFIDDGNDSVASLHRLTGKQDICWISPITSRYFIASPVHVPILCNKRIEAGQNLET
jgi:hypothetical protein